MRNYPDNEMGAPGVQILRCHWGRIFYGKAEALINSGVGVMAIATFCVLAYSQPSNDKTVVQKNQKTEQQKPASSIGTSSLEKAIREPIKEASEKPDTHSNEKLNIDRQIRDYTGQLSDYTNKLSRNTLWLVVATIVLAAIAVWQGWQLKRSVKVAESALTDLERPYIFVDLSEPVFKGAVATAGGKTYYNAPMRTAVISYMLYNGGRTPAILTHVRHQVESLYGNDRPAPLDSSSQDLKDERPEGDAIDKKRTLTVNFIHGEGTPTPAIFLIGFVRYRDIFGNNHITGFCARFDADTNRFVLDGDDRYNYTKDEGKKPPI